MRHLLALGAALSAAPLLSAQQTVALTRPDARLEDPFTRIAAVRELTDGRVYVSDMQDKAVVLADLARGTATPVGREGNGPGEYALPGALLPLPDNGTLLFDMMNSRFLQLGSDGKPGAFLSTPAPRAAPDRRAPGSGFALGGRITGVRGMDARGRIYFQGLPIGPDGQPADSVPVMRWDRVAPTYDTVAWLRLPKNAASVQTTRSGGQRIMAMRLGGNGAWPAADQWQVAPDGRIAIVSPEPYRVTWLRGSSRTTGPTIPYTPLRVTDAEKQEFLDQRARQRPVAIAVDGGGSGAANRALAASQAAQEEPEWPETLPPFTGPNSVLMTPEGDVWVLRTRKASDKTPTYDLFDAAGKLTGKVTLRPNSRVVGFGKGTVYVARADEDDLEYLERYRR